MENGREGPELELRWLETDCDDPSAAEPEQDVPEQDFRALAKSWLEWAATVG